MGGEDVEDEEEPAGQDKTSYKENPKYDPPQLRDLIDGSMSFWVHHVRYILPQGSSSKHTSNYRHILKFLIVTILVIHPYFIMKS